VLVETLNTAQSSPIHPNELVAELLTSGAVQVEVDGVVGVHQQLGDRSGQLEARLGDGVSAAVTSDERGGDRDERRRERGDEEREGDGEQHESESSAAFL